MLDIFLSTLSLRRATKPQTFYWRIVHISIHALLAESDLQFTETLRTNFGFLSTLSLRRATFYGTYYYSLIYDFYPRSPCGERQPWPRRRTMDSDISIHALLAESDDARGNVLSSYIIFLSTLSLRRATLKMRLRTVRTKNFYPRSPCGERRQNCRPDRPAGPISIHALLAESDTVGVIKIAVGQHFYPRSPCGERQSWTSACGLQRNFYPRSPCGERRDCPGG